MKTYYLVVLLRCHLYKAKVPSVYNVLYKSPDLANEAIKAFNCNFPENQYTVVPVEIPINMEVA